MVGYSTMDEVPSLADAALRALADGNRRRILALVRDQPRAVGEIADAMGMSQQAVSFHLRVLREAGLVTEHRARTRHLFAVRPEGLRSVQSFLESFWPSRLAALKRSVEVEAQPSRMRQDSMFDFSTSIDIDAPPEVVFGYLTSAERVVRWMGEQAELQARPGGTFAVDINGVPFRGQYLEVEPPRRVVLSWGILDSDDLPAGSSRVEITLAPTDGGTRLRLLHSGLPETRAQTHAGGWANYLGRLQLAAGGTDPGVDTWHPARGA